MKKILFLLIPLSLLSYKGFSQKIAFIDTEYILGHIPSYKAAQTQLDKLSEGWQKEIEEKFKEIDKLYADFQSNKVLLSEEMKKRKEDEIISKEKAAKDLQKKYFGPEGELYKKRQELVKPIQDEIYKTVQDMSTEAGYTGVFDTSSGTTIMYFNPKFDISDEVLKKMGYKN